MAQPNADDAEENFYIPHNFPENPPKLNLDLSRNHQYTLLVTLVITTILVTVAVVTIAGASFFGEATEDAGDTPAITEIYVQLTNASRRDDVTWRMLARFQGKDPVEDMADLTSTSQPEIYINDYRASTLEPSNNFTWRSLPWYQNVDAEDPRYTDSHHRFVCVYHSNAEGLTAPNGVRFDIEHFPFALCHVALFCCSTLKANLEPGVYYTDSLMEDFVSKALSSPYPEPEVMLGNGPRASDLAQFETLLNYLEAGTLGSAAGAWYKERNFAGIVLRWPDSASIGKWQRIPRLLGLLRDKLTAQYGLRLGLALQQDSAEPEFSLLANNLDSITIYLLPPRMSESSYSNLTFSYFTEETLTKIRKVYQHLNRSDADNRVCYLFPAETYTFRVSRDEGPLDSLQVQSLGPGIQGPVTRQPGMMAQFETCRIVHGYERLERNYGVLAALNDSWLSYTSHSLLRHFVDELQKNVSETCLGIWNPQWDDFANVCGNERAYPLSGFTAGLVVRSLCGEPSVNLDGLLTLPMHRALSMLASLSVTLLVSFIFKELFARGDIKDYLQCFVVIGRENSGRLLVKSGLQPISPPLMEPAPERPGLADGPEPDRSANIHTPICLPEAVTEECEVPKPDPPEIQPSTTLRRSSSEEYKNDVNQSRSSKSPTMRPPKIEGNDDIGGGTPKKASKASSADRKKASTSSVGRNRARTSRSTTPRSKSPRKPRAKSDQASVEQAP